MVRGRADSGLERVVGIERHDEALAAREVVGGRVVVDLVSDHRLVPLLAHDVGETDSQSNEGDQRQHSGEAAPRAHVTSADTGSASVARPAPALPTRPTRPTRPTIHTSATAARTTRLGSAGTRNRVWPNAGITPSVTTMAGTTSGHTDRAARIIRKTPPTARRSSG